MCCVIFVRESCFIIPWNSGIKLLIYTIVTCTSIKGDAGADLFGFGFFFLCRLDKKLDQILLWVNAAHDFCSLIPVSLEAQSQPFQACLLGSPSGLSKIFRADGQKKLQNPYLKRVSCKSPTQEASLWLTTFMLSPF